MLRKPTETKTEFARRVIGARLVWADRDHFRNLAGPDDSSLDATLLSRFALISEAQVPANEVNATFATANDIVEVARPPGYGRVVVVQTEWGTYDVKGVGVASNLRPLPAQHANGLLTFPAALAEVCTEQLARRALAHEGIETARCVALLLLPVYMRDPRVPSGQVRCGLLVMESFPRVYADPEDEGPVLALLEFFVRCEHALRRAGLTTTSACTNLTFVQEEARHMAYIDNVSAPPVVAAALADLQSTCPFIDSGEIDTLNVQLCLDLDRQKLRLVDFGSVEFRSTFDKPMLAVQLSRSPESKDQEIKSPRPHQRMARLAGFACSLSAHTAFSPVRRPSPRAALLEMVPFWDHGLARGTRDTTKRLAKLALAELALAPTDAELCSWAGGIIEEFSAA